MVEDIESNYDKWDAFILMHGTDTMAYTASALSFMLENLSKSVIITGSQVPFSQEPNDAAHNLLMSLTIAGHFEIPEVCIYFDHKLLRGNRSRKVDALGFDAFNSLNLSPLVKVGTEMKINWSVIRRPPRADQKTIFHKFHSQHVGVLKLFPGVSDTTIRNFLQPPLEACVMETYGTGNAPNNRPGFIEVLKEAIDRGVIIVNITQCHRGTVLQGTYATSSKLVEIGVLSGWDMTTEAALAKLSYLLANKELGMDRIKELVGTSIRGELTTDEPASISWEDEGFLKAVALALRTDGSKTAPLAPLLNLRASASGQHLQIADLPEAVLAAQHAAGSLYPHSPSAPALTVPKDDKEAPVDELRRALFPVLLCAAAQLGSVDTLSALIDAGADVSCTYGGQSALHVAARGGHLNAAQFLIEVAGARVDQRDSANCTPLDHALSMAHTAVSEYLKSKNATESQTKRVSVPISFKSGVVRHPGQK